LWWPGFLLQIRLSNYRSTRKTEEASVGPGVGRNTQALLKLSA
jgi:hypothetical protein